MGRRLATIAMAVVWFFFTVNMMLPDLFRDVANDGCTRFASGAPDVQDRDCHRLFPDGRDLVDEWNREHGWP